MLIYGVMYVGWREKVWGVNNFTGFRIVKMKSFGEKWILEVAKF